MSFILKTIIGRKNLYSYVPKYKNLIDVGFVKTSNKTKIIVPNITEKNKDLVNWINSIDVKELKKVDNIGSVTANKIIQNRPFNSFDTLNMIRGFGEIKYSNCLETSYLKTKYK